MERQKSRLRHLDGWPPHQIVKVSIPVTSNLCGLLHHLLVHCEPLVLQVLVTEKLDNARLTGVDAVCVAALVHIPECPSGMEGREVDSGFAGVVAPGGGKPPGAHAVGATGDPGAFAPLGDAVLIGQPLDVLAGGTREDVHAADAHLCRGS